MDLIGDIHGHADELVVLLEKLGYGRDSEGVFRYHNGSRMVIFVGDLIDRGPKIRETLEIVKAMVDAGVALCVRGNHEDNAIKFWTLSNDGTGYARKHNIKNFIQHSATIKAFQNREEEFEMYLEWFKTLPYFLELEEIRVVHASWHPNLMWANINPIMVSDLGKKIAGMILHGEEVQLPPGASFADKDGNVRVAARSQWWLNPRGLTYRQYLETYARDIPGLDGVIPDEALATLGEGYGVNEKPVFFGHYWLRGEPKIQAPNVCCLDYSVAKGGSLVAYRFDYYDTKLDNSKFVIVDSLN